MTQLFLSLLFWALLPMVAEATVRFVDTSACSGTYSVANRSCTGADGSSFTSVQNALLAGTVAGDIIIVRAGTNYSGFNTNNFVHPNGTSFSNAVTITNYNSHCAIAAQSSCFGRTDGEAVTMGGLAFGGAAGGNVAAHHIIYNGITFDGRLAGGNVETITLNQGAHHIRIQYSEITGAYNNGVGLVYGNNNGLSSDFNEFLYNNVHDNAYDGTTGDNPLGTGPNVALGTGRGHAFYVQTSNNTFRGNTIHHNGEYGIHNYNGSGGGQSPDNNLYEGNIVYHNGQNTSRYGAICCGGILMYTGSNNVAINNIVYDHGGGTGIDTGGPSGNFIYNNTVYGNNATGILLSNGNPIVRNNIVYNNGGTISGAALGASTIDHNLTTNPSFVNAGTGDFHLQVGSAAIDAGTTIASVTTDADGNPRPSGNAYDIGAYELLGTTPPTPRFSPGLNLRRTLWTPSEPLFSPVWPY